MTRLWAWMVALAALALTLWLAGPRAWVVLAQQAPSRSTGPLVHTDRVAFRACPAWLSGALLLAVMADLQSILQGTIGVMDDAGAAALAKRLEGSPWVAKARLERVFPDRFVARLVLRRPELQVGGGGDELPIALFDAVGSCLPPVGGTDLPVALVAKQPAPAALPWGLPHPDPEVVAAAAVAAEWRTEIGPRVAGAPALVEIDARNLGYRFVADGRWSEVRVGLVRHDGAVVHLGYGHPPGSRAPRVPVDTKATILAALLSEYPGLAGLRGGDLRFGNRWRDWLIPRPNAVTGR